MNKEPEPEKIKKVGEVKDTRLVKEYRCPVCKRLLMKGEITIIETRCPKCKKISIIKDM